MKGQKTFWDNHFTIRDFTILMVLSQRENIRFAVALRFGDNFYPKDQQIEVLRRDSDWRVWLESGVANKTENFVGKGSSDVLR